MNTTLWAVLGVIGTALAGAFAVRLVTLIFERRSRLIVSVTVHQSFQMESVYEEIRKFMSAQSTTERLSDDYFRISSKLRTIMDAQHYMRFDLKNNSNKKLSALTFCAHSMGSAFFQVGTGELAEIKSDIPVALGELQPKREIVVHLLCGTLWGAYSPADIKKNMIFSADELGSVTYRFPLPFYQRMRVMSWGNRFGIFIGSILVAVAIAIFAINS